MHPYPDHAAHGALRKQSQRQKAACGSLEQVAIDNSSRDQDRIQGVREEAGKLHGVRG